MERGQRYMIYEDPFTKQKEEGIAVLEYDLDMKKDNLVYWNVRMDDGTGDIVNRWIDINQEPIS